MLNDMLDMIHENSLFFYGWVAALIAGAIVAAKCFQVILVKIFHSKLIFRGELARSISDNTKTPLLWLLIALAISLVLPFTQLPEPWLSRFSLWLRPISIALFGWFVIGCARGTGDWLENYYPGKTRDALGTRRFNTQIKILMRVVITILVVLTIVGMAMVVPSLRQLGMSLFASAGVAGIVLGIAAKESFSNIIAGVQLALTQQILLGDTVIVNDNSGTIEEITSSYVVLRTWDLRRIIVPLRYFMENSFENWTYQETDMFGPVYLYSDYTVDLDALREEGERIVKSSQWWDGKRYEILVADISESSLKLRVAISAKNTSDLWNLQCEMREKLISYLKNHQSWALPKARSEQRAVENWEQTKDI